MANLRHYKMARVAIFFRRLQDRCAENQLSRPKNLLKTQDCETLEIRLKLKCKV